MKDVKAMVDESANSFATCSRVSADGEGKRPGRTATRKGFPTSTYLGNPTNVLIAVLLREAQVLIQPKAHIVAVEAVGCQANVK